jgi:hypothetical protein
MWRWATSDSVGVEPFAGGARLFFVRDAVCRKEFHPAPFLRRLFSITNWKSKKKNAAA